MGKFIDLAQFGKWFTREAVPAIVPVAETVIVNSLDSEMEGLAQTFAQHNNIPPDVALSYAKEIESLVTGRITANTGK